MPRAGYTERRTAGSVSGRGMRSLLPTRRTIAWLHRNRRLLIRYERRPELHQAFLDLGCALIRWHLLPHGTEHFC